MFNRYEWDGIYEWGQKDFVLPLTNIKYGENRLGNISTSEFTRQVTLALEELFNAEVYMDARRKIICQFPLSSSFEISIYKL